MIKRSSVVSALVVLAFTLGQALDATGMTVTFATAGNTNWICPAGVSNIAVECYGGGGGGGGANRTTAISKGGGGGGGAYAMTNTLPVTPGNQYAIIIPAAAVAGSGGTAGVAGSATPGGTGGIVGFTNEFGAAVFANGGVGGGPGSNGTVGTGGVGGAAGAWVDGAHKGGNGANADSTGSGGGGSAASDLADGTNAVSQTAGAQTTGSDALHSGGAGGNGTGTAGSSGNRGNPPGGGGSGGRTTGSGNAIVSGSPGAVGQIILTYKVIPTVVLAVSNPAVLFDGNPQAATVMVVSSSAPGSVTNVKYNGSVVIPTAAGNYAVTADFVPNDTTNYNILTSQSAGSFVISSDTIIGYSVIGPFAYDGTRHSPAVSFVGSTGARTTNFTGVSVSYDSVNAPTNAGTYSMHNTVAGDGNYGGATNSQLFTINPAPLTIRANDGIKLYGQTLTFAGNEFTTFSLLYGGDAVTSLTLTSAGTASAAPAGNYDIVPTAALGNGLGNYAITYSNGTLVVVSTGPKVLFLGQGASGFKSCFMGLCTNDASAKNLNLAVSSYNCISVLADFYNGVSETSHSALMNTLDQGYDYIVFTPNKNYVRDMPELTMETARLLKSYTIRRGTKVLVALVWNATGAVTNTPKFEDHTYRVCDARSLSCVPAGLAWKAVLQDGAIGAAECDPNSPNDYAKYTMAATLFYQLFGHDANYAGFVQGALNTNKQSKIIQDCHVAWNTAQSATHYTGTYRSVFCAPWLVPHDFGGTNKWADMGTSSELATDGQLGSIVLKAGYASRRVHMDGYTYTNPLSDGYFPSNLNDTNAQNAVITNNFAFAFGRRDADNMEPGMIMLRNYDPDDNGDTKFIGFDRHYSFDPYFTISQIDSTESSSVQSTITTGDPDFQAIPNYIGIGRAWLDKPDLVLIPTNNQHMTDVGYLLQAGMIYTLVTGGKNPASNYTGWTSDQFYVLEMGYKTLLELGGLKHVDTPPIPDDGSTVTTGQNMAVSVGFTGMDLDDLPLTVQVMSGPANGSLTGSGTNRIYTPNAGFAGTNFIVYTLNNGVLNSLPVTNTIIVTPRPFSGPAPQVNLNLSGLTNLVLSGSVNLTNSGLIYWVCSSTNLALPLTNWSIVATNAFDAQGNFSNQIPVTPGSPQTFYRMQMP